MNITLTHVPCPEHPGSPWLLGYRTGTLHGQERFQSEELARQRWRELESYAPEVERVIRINRLLAGTGYDPVDLIAIASAARSYSPASPFTEVAQALLATCRSRLGRNTVDCLSPVTLDNYSILFGAMSRHFGCRPCDSITPADFHAFLGTLTDNYGVPGRTSTNTKRTYLGALRMVLLYAGVEEPLQRLPKYQDKRRQIQYFSVAQLKRIFAVTPARERAAVAISSFGVVPLGIACQLTPDCVNLEARTITIPASISLDRRVTIICAESWDQGRFLPGLPDVLWSWLESYSLQPTHPVKMQVRLKRAVGCWIQDGFRRTGATYYYAAHGKDAVEAVLSQAGEMLTIERFVGEATAAEAEEFFSLDPSKVAFVRERAAYGFIRDLPKAELERLLFQKPIGEIAREYKVADNTILRYKRDLGIKGPGLGYWSTRRAAERRRQSESGLCDYEI